MRTRRSVTDVARNFSEVVTHVAIRGERVELVRAGRVIAAIVPAPEGVPAGALSDVLRGLPRLGRGEAEAMARAIATGRAKLRPPRSPWDS
jgi:antitoxin (DNA-binding transcriptional repressor) of toxin-antitoxin stability system